MLRGGSNEQLKLPNANAVPLLSVTGEDQPNRRIGKIPREYIFTSLLFTNMVWDFTNNFISVPVVAPSVLVLTKIKRWMFLTESTRPYSIRRAERDVDDIEALLTWLTENNLHVDFAGYSEKPKQDLLSMVRKLYQKVTGLRPLIEAGLEAEDFALIRN